MIIDNEKKLIFRELKSLLNLAYCPYSNFPVACVIKSGGKYFKGVNVENASFPVGICAERNAISQSITLGHRVVDEVYLLSSSNNSFVMPCGMCRQFMSEFMESDQTKIYVFKPSGQFKIFTIGEILLNRFRKNDLYTIQ